MLKNHERETRLGLQVYIEMYRAFQSLSPSLIYAVTFIGQKFVHGNSMGHGGCTELQGRYRETVLTAALQGIVHYM